MGAAAEFFTYRRLTNFHHANRLTIFLFKQSDSSFSDGLVVRDGFCSYCQVLAYPFINLSLNLLELSFSCRRQVGEVESKPLWFYQRTLLINVPAQYLS